MVAVQQTRCIRLALCSLFVALGVCYGTVSSAVAQSAIPIRELPVPNTTSVLKFANIFSIHALPNGGVLVNDGLNRQLIALDAALSHPRVVLDSSAGNGHGYGPRASPLIPFTGDSSLFVDGQAGALLVIDPTGKIARTVAAPAGNAMAYLAASTSGTDGAGNLLYRVPTIAIAVRTTGVDGSQIATNEPPDSAPVIRANFETRHTDTIARLKQVKRMRTVLTISPAGARALVVTINPLETLDEWAITADGSIAIVRGADYHVDWVRANGTRESTARMPFDWKPLTDSDKQRMLDSVLSVADNIRSSSATLGPNGVTDALRSMVINARPVLGGASPLPPDIPKATPATANGVGDIRIAVVPTSALPDYYPPIRVGAVRGDADGNLWILPSTSAHSQSGELVYDVVNAKGQLFQRVRIPTGRSIAGFARNGVVFLMARDATGAWTLERSRI